MEKKTVKTFVYRGFGFPIKLINVPMRKVFGKWAMDINFNKLRLAVVYCLLRNQAPLSGDEIKFIRKYLDMTTTEFGNIFKVSHVAVMNWEKGINQISTTSDIYLRLYVLNQMQNIKDKEFRSFYSKISPESLEKNKGKRHILLSINIDEDLETA